MKKIALVFICLMTQLLYSQSANVKIENQADGQKLLVDGKPLMINGMNWDYYPIGTNYNYSLWNQKMISLKQLSTVKCHFSKTWV